MCGSSIFYNINGNIDINVYRNHNILISHDISGMQVFFENLFTTMMCTFYVIRKKLHFRWLLPHLHNLIVKGVQSTLRIGTQCITFSIRSILLLIKFSYCGLICFRSVILIKGLTFATRNRSTHILKSRYRACGAVALLSRRQGLSIRACARGASQKKKIDSHRVHNIRELRPLLLAELQDQVRYNTVASQPHRIYIKVHFVE